MNHNIDANNVPLKFEDIVDKKIYDKMRPPKPGGKYVMSLMMTSHCAVPAMIIMSVAGVYSVIFRIAGQLIPPDRSPGSIFSRDVW